MPQLDMFSWFNQVITTTIVMFVFYMFLVLFFLPTTAAIMKGRNKLVQLRTVTIAIIGLKINAYINDIKENLMNVLINNFVPVYGYYYPVNNNQLATNILGTCYRTNMTQIDKAFMDYALVLLLTTNNSITEENVMVSFEELEKVNSLLKN